MIEVGDRVRVKKGSYEKLGIGGGAPGGEAVVTDVCEDKHGQYYVVTLNRSGKRRSVRRVNLIVHYKQNRRKKDESEVRRKGRWSKTGRRIKAL
jgi:hypothetical protein